MDASNLTNGSGDEVLAKRSVLAPKSVQASAVRPETKKVVRDQPAKNQRQSDRG